MLKLMMWSLPVWMLVTVGLSAETYTIDTTATSKEVRAGDFRMGTPTNPEGVALTANNYYLMRDGEPFLPVMGELHYTRYPEWMWRDAIRKMKAGGIDIVASYSFWIHHEEIEGEFDFSGRRDLRRFVEICAEEDMQFWLRIGPWCHGEVKNGGIPDWILEKGFQARRSNPEYLAAVRRLYEQYYAQVEGLFYKDGGPIIGVQLENEYGGPPEHIRDLKRIARETGFDVPYYTVTGWNNVPIPEKEVLPVQAGYPDDFWTRGTQRTPLNEQYLMMTGIPINTGVGTDVLPVLEVYGGRTYDPADYPWLTAELGLGIQWTERRRPVIDTNDAAALLLVKLAGGANCVGYYVYHGGSNPDGKLTHLAETGFNECPLVSYDFQAAVGEFGEIQPKYHALKLAHYFLQDFGADLAPMIPAMPLPEQRPSGPEDVETFRVMVRTDKDSGYLFFNNYQRFVENKNLEDIVVATGGVNIPAQGSIDVPANAYGIWPINLELEGGRLEYATAQLFAKFEEEAQDTLFFFEHEGIGNEFRIVETIPNDSGEQQFKVINRNVEPGIEGGFTFAPEEGKPTRFVVFPQKLAERTTRLELWGERRLVVTDGADVIAAEGNMDVRGLGRAEGTVWIYPAPEGLEPGEGWRDGGAEGIFHRYDWTTEPVEVEVDWNQTGEGETGRYAISIPSDALEGVYDVYLDFDQVSDYMTVKVDGRLIGDWYYIGPHYRPSLRHWRDAVLGKTLEVDLRPITEETQVYLEDRFRPDFSERASIAELRDVTATPMYRKMLER